MPLFRPSKSESRAKQTDSCEVLRGTDSWPESESSGSMLHTAFAYLLTLISDALRPAAQFYLLPGLDDQVIDLGEVSLDTRIDVPVELLNSGSETLTVVSVTVAEVLAAKLRHGHSCCARKHGDETESSTDQWWPM